MFHSALDRWDEKRARRSDASKEVSSVALDADLAFPKTSGVDSISDFCALADAAAADPSYFGDPDEFASDIRWEGDWITFRSSLRTGIEPNDIVVAKVTEQRPSNRALVVLHHWNAGSRYPQLAQFFAWQGITVVEMALPYHLERSRPGSSHADYMLSPNLGRTLQSMRQAVLDGRSLVRALREKGHSEVSVLGMSLGSWVAGLIAAHESEVANATLFLTADSLAEMAWTGRATRHIRATLDGRIDLAQLRTAWAPLDLERHADRLARSNLGLQLVLAKRDTVVLPELSERLVASLQEAGADPSVLRLNCGHYSLSLPPYIVRAGFSTVRLLRNS